MICPKCSKEAWVVTVERRGLKGVHPTVYLYVRYRHYAGSRKSITLKALEKILRSESRLWFWHDIMEKAREKAGEKTVDHYVRKS
jgi:hypothetical protein